MKFQITFKSPDAVRIGIRQAMDQLDLGNESEVSKDLEEFGEMDDFDKSCAREEYRDKLHSLVGRWVKSGEYLTIEIDTELETCTVLPRK